MTDNPQAFPTAGSMAGQQYVTGKPGMTLRDWFAGQALSGVMADANVRDTPANVSRGCYVLADAMLAERAKGGQS